MLFRSGAKLAEPDKTVVAMTGDGSYMFSVPSSVHWMAAKYQTPFLQIVFNNRGWKAPRFSALAVHPDGYASRAEDLDVSFDPSPNYAAIAEAAGGAHARKVERPEEVEAAVAEVAAAASFSKISAVAALAAGVAAAYARVAALTRHMPSHVLVQEGTSSFLPFWHSL